MKTITLLNADEERVFRGLLDGAARHYGAAGAEAVLLFLRKIDAALPVPAPVNNVVEMPANKSAS